MQRLGGTPEDQISDCHAMLLNLGTEQFGVDEHSRLDAIAAWLDEDRVRRRRRGGCFRHSATRRDRRLWLAHPDISARRPASPVSRRDERARAAWQRDRL